MATGVTDRERAKADRHRSLVRAAARLFAERGYAGVTLEDLGAQVGISGPALYRHFRNKQALLAEILLGVSERLLAGGRAARDEHPPAAEALPALVDFHVAFALADADVIRIQDHDLDQLPAETRARVRDLQRQYLDIWVDVLHALRPERTAPENRTRALAAIGLINSTPHSARVGTRESAHGILREMALAALRT
ncbi:TetR/AcrR family transcriptional regulator [Microbacterium sp.]|uniref:TetR/AcrR family transcriptional regulator n=1 Tax=Microbacterium sp. TaxID=51671 RepID=UPI0039E64138